jgi:hypothetical protein
LFYAYKKGGLYSYCPQILKLIKQNKITEVIIKSYDLTASIKSETDVDISEIFNMINAALIGITFQQITIDNYIVERAQEILIEREESNLA